MFRHGAREPLHGASWNKSVVTTGNLIKHGLMQHYNLGLFLRKRYINELKFLPEEYDDVLMHTKSSNKQRTFQSAMA